MDFADGMPVLMQWGAMMAEMPLEDWLEDLERCDTTAPILDPTLYRRYLASGRREVLLDLLRSACAMKASVKRAQKGVLEGSVR